MSDLLKFITCGSVDDGKSTLIGHILYDAKLLYADQEEALLLDSKVGSRGGAIDYSLLLDGLMAEREQGITIDVAYRYFTTDKRSFIVADTPGHEEYTRNMAVGASFADLAIILVDATQGVLIQTKRHARICALMGIKYFIFAVNKMDLAGYSEEAFQEITAQIDALSAELGLANVQIIPVSATAGDNVTTRSANMPWYEGASILEYLETVDIKSTSKEQGFYMPVQRVCRPNHTFRGFQGQIEAGSVQVGDEITVLPSGEQASVKEILVGDKSRGEAFTGQPVTITLNKEIDVSRGCVLSIDSAIGNAKVFQTTLLWMDDAPLAAGKDYYVKVGTKRIAGRIQDILYKIDVNTGEHIESDQLSKNEIALCRLVLDEEVPIDPFRNHKTMGELILIDRLTNMTSACGVVEALEDEDEDNHAVIYGNGLTVRTLLFDEYFYSEESHEIGHYRQESKRLGIGDPFPLEGESYHYPAYCDILATDQDAAVIVRNGVITDVQALSAYQYSGLPVVNGNGFAIRIRSAEDAARFFRDLEVLERQVLCEQWMRFETYRRIVFTNNYWGL